MTVPAYNYSRLRFLLATEEFVENSDISNYIVTGKRLLSRAPDDVQVKFQLVHVLSLSSHMNEVKQSEFYANQLVKSQPSNAKYHALLAGSYLNVWLLSNNSVDAQNAVAEYQQYLKLAPTNADFRPRAVYMIKTLQAHGLRK